MGLLEGQKRTEKNYRIVTNKNLKKIFRDRKRNESFNKKKYEMNANNNDHDVFPGLLSSENSDPDLRIRSLFQELRAMLLLLKIKNKSISNILFICSGTI